MVLDWKVTVNGEVFEEQAGKASTAIVYAMSHYLTNHGGIWLHNNKALDNAQISIVKVTPEPIKKCKKEPPGHQVSLSDVQTNAKDTSSEVKL